MNLSVDNRAFSQSGGIAAALLLSLGVHAWVLSSTLQNRVPAATPGVQSATHIVSINLQQQPAPIDQPKALAVKPAPTQAKSTRQETAPANIETPKHTQRAAKPAPGKVSSTMQADTPSERSPAAERESRPQQIREPDPELDSVTSTASAQSTRSNAIAAVASNAPGLPTEPIVERIRLALTRYFDYPLLARRRGWQGEVRLSFVLHQDGRIEDIAIAHSSGYRVLDHAAYSTLAKVERIDGPLDLHWGSRRLELPVIYRLHEGG